MSLQALKPTEIEAALCQLPQWCYQDQAIQRNYQFDDFKQAFGFISKVAELAEQQAHHPDWSNSYNKVQIRLTTHQIGAVSQRDITLAKAIEALYQNN
ncbi:4a-hydroxytetrahydrobiopterin dehydratase [Agarivorans sp.]|uniref:4a-hydroxytetrahydrobiopterin dehydratase n=1 Tax=Agarivorans sp. TaxID=1872412 RepID=UPI003D01D6AC